jgi:hypothetical protein
MPPKGKGKRKATDSSDTGLAPKRPRTEGSSNLLLDNISPKSKLPTTYVLKQLQSLKQNPDLVISQIDELIQRIQDQHINKKCRAAADVTAEELKLLFGITEPQDLHFSHENYSTHEIPKDLQSYLTRLQICGWDRMREQSSRIRADLLLIPAMDQARQNQNISLVIPSNTQSGDRKDLIMHHEYDIEVEITQPDDPKTTWFIQGRTDWAFVHSGRNAPSSLLICVEAKSRQKFSEAEAQLSTYLALCQHKRKMDNKLVSLVQGFATDGQRYSFQHLHPDGLSYLSPTYDTKQEGNLVLVYNIIIDLIESAIKTSPTTTPVKGTIEHKRKTSVEFAKEKFKMASPIPISFDDEDVDVYDHA